MPFAWAEYEAPASTLAGIKGRAILSINDHPDIRLCFDGFDGFDAESLELGDSLSNHSGASAQRKELLVFSWGWWRTRMVCF